MIQIIDFEDGLQEFFASRFTVDTTIETWDLRGGFRFDKILPANKNIIILSKPFDCLQRGVLSGKYPQDDFKKLQDWSRRNWRYTSPEIYEHINSLLTQKIENKLVIHPEELGNPVTKKRIEKYIGSKFDWDISEYETFYTENINLR